MDTKDVIPFVKNKTCLITGGGGSIGSELARTLRSLGAGHVIAADISENGLHSLMQDCLVTAEIVSVRDYCAIDRLMARYKPDIIFHAAAHKHVTFMEKNPCEAVKNNIRGTEITAELADKYGAERFVLISTDKAVEPVSVMGASKRICEMIIYEKSKSARNAVFSAVRFGNVIGSAGSVIPLFERQVAKGCVTITDPRVTRYFMTISQAAGLAVSSLAAMRGGDVFVFDMGESVSILGLAERMIREKGLRPYEDVEIKFIGLRDGDKLHEKLFYDFEAPEECGIEGVRRVSGSSVSGIENSLKRLYSLAASGDDAAVKKLMFSICGDF